jgi:hypothetical protein
MVESKDIVMNIFLWILQSLLALHTLAGAVWKFAKTAEETMPSIGAIPQPAWLGMSVIEILCVVALLIPALFPSLKKLAPIAAIVIALEMLVLCALHIASGNGSHIGPMIYWLVVAAICGFIAYKRKSAFN